MIVEILLTTMLYSEVPMNKKEEKLLRWLVRILFWAFLATILLQWIAGMAVHGLSPLVFLLLWIAQWRLFYIRGMFPGKIYTFIYLLVAVLTVVIALRQIYH